MNFNKMKIGKKGNVKGGNDMFGLIITVIVIVIAGVIAINIAPTFAANITTLAVTKQAAATAANKTLLASMYGLLSNDALFEVIIVITIVLIMLFSIFAILRKVANQMK